LQQRCPRPPDQAPAYGEQPEQGDEAVAQEIEGVRLDRLRAGEEATDRLDDAVAEVERDDNCQRPPVARGKAAGASPAGTAPYPRAETVSSIGANWVSGSRSQTVISPEASETRASATPGTCRTACSISTAQSAQSIPVTW
jgi:hypothetical protein